MTSESSPVLFRCLDPNVEAKVKQSPVARHRKEERTRICVWVGWMGELDLNKRRRQECTGINEVMNDKPENKVENTEEKGMNGWMDG